MKLLTAIVLLSLFSAVTAGGEPLIRTLEIHRSVKDQNQLTDPAQLSAEWPDRGAPWFLLDFGARVAVAPGLAKTSLWVASAFAEHHHSSIPGDERRITIAGLALSGTVFDISSPPHIALLPDLSLGYKGDGLEHTGGVVASALSDIVGTPLQFGSYYLVPGADALIEPSLGLDYENRIDAKADALKGSVLRLRLSTNAVVEPFRGTRAFERVELETMGTYWNDLGHTRVFSGGPRDHRFWSISLRYFFDQNRRSSVGLTRINGEDPVQSQPLQKSTRLAFEFNISRDRGKR